MTDRRHVDREPAYVLHRRAYRETSFLVELLTADMGRISVVARGARRTRAATALVATLEPFSRLLVSCTGRGSLLTLTGAEADDRRRLAGRALFAGFYLNELLVRVLRADDAHPELFTGYDAALAALASGAALEPALRQFEKLLLKETGYELVFHVDAASGEPIVAERRYRFTPELGFTAVADARSPSYGGRVLLAIGGDHYEDEEVRIAAKRIMRLALAPHLGGRPLESRALFRRGGER